MLVSLSLDNAKGEAVALHDLTPPTKRALVSVTGLVGIGNLRQSKRVRPQAHGSINESRFEEGRSINLEGEIASNVSVADAVAEGRAVFQPMLETLDSGAALMKWEEQGGLKLQRLVKLDSDLLPALLGVAPRLVYQCSFFAEDPRAYSQTSSTVVGAGITGVAFEPTFSKTTGSPKSVCVDAGHIYWCDGVTHAIGRAAIGGGTIENEWIKLASGFERVPQSLAIDAAHIYWGRAESLFYVVGRAAIGGGTIEEEFVSASIGHATKAVAVNASNIYFATERFIGRATLAGGSVEPEWLPVKAAQAIALDATYLYYGQENSIGRVKLNGEENTPKWITDVGTVTGLAVNATFIYWTSKYRAIGRAKIGGTEHVYWGESTGYISRSKDLVGGGPKGSACVVTQAGNRPAPLVFKINGPIENPSVTRAKDGARISLGGTITAGNYAEVDTANRTVTLNGSTSLLSFLNPQATNWEAFQAPAGASETYELTGSNATAAKLEAIYRACYA